MKTTELIKRCIANGALLRWPGRLHTVDRRSARTVVNGADGSIPVVDTAAEKDMIAIPVSHFRTSVKSDADERRLRLQTLLTAHEMVFFYRITRIFRSLRANRPGATAVSMA